MVPELRQQQAHGTLSVEVLDEAGDRVLDHGTLTFIDNQIDPLTRTILCKAIFENRDEALWPGAFVTAPLHLSNLPRAIVVPATAILPGSTGSFVYVVTPKQTAEIRQVEVGTTNRAETVILKGLQEGETVVTEGQFQIEQGTRVETRTFGRAPVTSGATAKPNSSS
jgi:multidrug efflux system membrane fusion protein